MKSLCRWRSVELHSHSLFSVQKYVVLLQNLSLTSTSGKHGAFINYHQNWWLEEVLITS